MSDPYLQALKPDYVAPVVAALTHESCKDTGKLFEVGGGWVAQVRWQRSKGHVFPLTQSAQTPEAIAAKWATIGDFQDAEYPTDPQGAFPVILENLDKAKAEVEKEEAERKAAAAVPGGTDAALEKDFQSARVFRILKEMITPDLVKKVRHKSRYSFEAV